MGAFGLRCILKKIIIIKCTPSPAKPCLCGCARQEINVGEEKGDSGASGDVEGAGVPALSAKRACAGGAGEEGTPPAASRGAGEATLSEGACAADSAGAGKGAPISAWGAAKAGADPSAPVGGGEASRGDKGCGAFRAGSVIVGEGHCESGDFAAIV